MNLENTDKITIKAQLNTNSDIDRLFKIIEKKGGKIWSNYDKKRAYFGDDCHYFVSRKVYAQPYNAYVDFKTKELVIEVNECDFNKNKNSIEDYKKAFINSLRECN